MPTREAPRKKLCPGCHAALIRQRRALAGKLCPECLRDRVREMDAKAKR